MAGIKINQIKELYLAENIEDLQKLQYSSLATPGQNYDVLIRVSQEVWKTAKECENNGDQEKAYVCFFKYCDLAYRIRNSPQYKKDKLYYDTTVSSKSVEEAYNHSKTLIVELKKRYDERQTKPDQIESARSKLQSFGQSVPNLNLELLEFEKEKEVNGKWQTNFFLINKLMKCSEIYSDFSPLERETIRLRKRLIMFQDQNSKQRQKIVGLQESLKIFGDKNRKLERRNQDLKDSRLCKVCMDQEVSQILNPCNHVICCNNCINSIQKCPISRKNIESSQMIYFS